MLSVSPRRLVLAIAFLLATTVSALAGPPVGYYNTVDPTNSATLRQSLHAVIDDHALIPYTDTVTDTWNVLELADEDPNNSSRILDIYLNASYPKWGAGNNDYNREHSWPSSYGFPNEGSSVYPYSDCHHLFLSNDSRNTSRGNKPFAAVGAGGTEYTTVVNDGVGGGSGVYPGWSNWANPTYWETWWDRRGDVARALMYMDVRYEGGTHGGTGASEPNLILTNNLALISASNTGTNLSVAYMGMLASLLQWHSDDPVDAKEMARNDVVYSFQGNRNPFIDHPEWVTCLFTGDCSAGTDTIPPAAPLDLVATAGDGSVDLGWTDSPEGDLGGYRVYRSTTMGGPYVAASGLLSLNQFTDNGRTNGVTYYYVVTASDLAGNESADSDEASATPEPGIVGGGALVWINEFHYDNAGTDTGEFVEIAGPAGTSLAGWTLVGYNGNGGAAYATISLGGALPDQQAGYGTLSFAFLGLQNGAPDGIALVNDFGTVIEFLSYEGGMVAADGPAAGLVAVDVGVAETSATPIGYSLQRIGIGNRANDFTWQAPQANTAGLRNTGQTFIAVPTNQSPVALANGPYAEIMNLDIAFSADGSADADGSIVSWLWQFGDGNTSSVANPVHAYATAGVFEVILTVTDNLGAAAHDTTSATISDPSSVPPGALVAARVTNIYPNPFNPATTIRFELGGAGHVQVEIFSVKGERVRTLVAELRGAGEQSVIWNGTSDDGQLVPSGAYFCRVRQGHHTDTRPLLLLK